MEMLRVSGGGKAKERIGGAEKEDSGAELDAPAAMTPR
jgi:hypothetical protein